MKIFWERLTMISTKSLGSTRLSKGIAMYFRSAQERVLAPSRWQVLVFLIVLITSFTLSLSNYNSFQLGSYMDDASYAVLAQSLVSSKTYGLMNAPSQPASTRYPFGFPLILSAFVRLYPMAPNMLKVASLVATILNSILIFWGWS